MRVIAAVAVASLALSACTRATPLLPAAAWTLAVDPLPSPAGDGTAQPQLTESKDGVILSWLENASSQTALKFSERTASGWTQPRLVSFGDNFVTNYADIPSVVRLSDGTLVAHWMQMNGTSASGYDLRLARSTDDGRTWSAPFSPHHDGTMTQHGFASLFETNGGLGVVWLDGRAMKPGVGADDDGSGDMGLRAAHFDRAWNQLSEDAVDRRVCECCPTATAVSVDGPIVAYRNRSADEVRDIYVSRFTGDAWTVPARVHDDGWTIDGCPINGPVISAVGRDVAIAWFTAPKDEGHALVAFSKDGGRTYSRPVQVDDAGSLGRVDVAQLADGTAVVGWIEAGAGRTTYRVRRIERGGERSPAVTISDLGAARNNGYPRLARHGQELIFAWTGSKDRLRVETASARLP
ncbi:MAG: sialidase family protein [Vicinamibacterales bacterium]